MEIVGLEPRRSDLARGIVIARAAVPLDSDQQRALWEALGASGVTDPGEVGPPDDAGDIGDAGPGASPEDPGARDDATEGDDDRARQWLAAPWLPPAPSELAEQRAALTARLAATAGPGSREAGKEKLTPTGAA